MNPQTIQRFRCALFFIVISISLISCTSSSETGPLKPNIIYIMADDLGYGDLGCYGSR